MFNSFLIFVGLKPDPALFAGRPDRKRVDDITPRSFGNDGTIRWGNGERRYGEARVGDHWGEWVLNDTDRDENLSPPLPIEE